MEDEVKKCCWNMLYGMFLAVLQNLSNFGRFLRVKRLHEKNSRCNLAHKYECGMSAPSERITFI